MSGNSGGNKRMSGSCGGSEVLEAVAAKVAELRAQHVYTDAVSATVDELLARLPAPEQVTAPTQRARVLLLRCQVRLLLPSASKEAEADCHAALKLHHDCADAWVELSECLLRRNALKDACEALESALRLNAAHTAALCKYSQIQRSRCGQAGVAASTRRALVEDSVARARAAVRSNVDDANAWYTLALALLSTVMVDGMHVAQLRKAAAAMQQAEKKSPDDPDVQYNMGVLQSLLGCFGDAARHFARAHALDAHRLKGTRRLCEDNVAVLTRARTRMRNVTTIGKSEYKRLCDLAAGAGARVDKKRPSTESKSRNETTTTNSSNVDAQQPATTTVVVVVDILSEPTMQPLVLLVTDAAGTFSLLLVYEVRATAFKIGDVVTLDAAATTQAGATEVAHEVPVVAFLGNDAFALTLRQYYSNGNALQVNGHALPASAKAPVQLSSRLFA